jgi:hypothetical protein
MRKGELPTPDRAHTAHLHRLAVRRMTACPTADYRLIFEIMIAEGYNMNGAKKSAFWRLEKHPQLSQVFVQF